MLVKECRMFAEIADGSINFHHVRLHQMSQFGNAATREPSVKQLPRLKLLGGCLKEYAMPTYISLVQFTDKGIQDAKDATHRVADCPQQQRVA